MSGSSTGRSHRDWIRICKQLRNELPPICWLCGQAIDLSLDPRHKKSWTLDHVKPLSEHPELAHTISNLRPAHRDCNSKRGAHDHSPVPPKGSRRW